MPVINDAVKSNLPVVRPATFKQSIPAILIGVAAAFGGFLYGYDTGTISGILAMEHFRKTFGVFWDVNIPSNFDLTNPKPGYDLSTGKQSLVTSILSLGTFAGSLIGAPISDAVGRRPGIWIALVIFSIGVAMQTASTAVPLFAGGRVVAGLGVGIVSTIVPMYQSETAPRWIRGAVVSAYQWAITIGLLIAAIVNKGTANRSDTGCYRIPIAIQLVFGAILGLLFFLIPESPRWLVKRQRRDEACQVLARMYSTTPDDEVVQAEAFLIENNLQIELSVSTDSYMDCFKTHRNYLSRTLTGIFLQAWQQLTGINFIFYYGTTFFQSAIPSADPFVFTIISNIVNVFSTVPGMWAMDKVGRRPLLFYGALWMTVCEYIVAIVGTTQGTGNKAAGRSLVAFVCLYIAAFASTWGPGAWVVCGEIFPLAIRAKALSLCVASNWLWNFAIGYATPYLVHKGHGYAGLGTKVFFIWGSTCLIASLFAFFTIYETAGLSLEEVDEMYASIGPLQSTAANAEITQRRNVLEAEAVQQEVERTDMKAGDLKLETV
ncbi:Plasma membrane low glucose sensor [Tilletia horrida]|nr:Plasma membrane low glucose sensor [Tilletia horrida]